MARPFRFPYTTTTPAYNSGTVPTKPNEHRRVLIFNATPESANCLHPAMPI